MPIYTRTLQIKASSYLYNVKRHQIPGPFWMPGHALTSRCEGREEVPVVYHAARPR